MPESSGESSWTFASTGEVDAILCGWMGKLLAQYLALGTMIISIINVQCALSCSMQSIAHSPSTQADGAIGSTRSEHACCPREADPKPKQEKRPAACVQPEPDVTEARLRISAPAFSQIVAVEAIAGDQQDYTALIETDLLLVAAPDPSGLSQLTSISILRI